MHSSRKPVRKCHGCGLNFADYCGVYDDPRQMWRTHYACPGYKNEKMLAEYLAEQARHPPDARKEKRRQVQKARATETHQQGDRHTLISVKP